MVYGAIQGLLGSLDDPYSSFLEPLELQSFKDELQGSFDGIGVEIGLRDEVLTVIAPLQGTPAQVAGLEAGDRILAVGGESTVDLTLDEVVSLIKGPKGSEVTLTVLKENEEGAKDIRIVRDEIEVPVLESEIKDGYAYIWVYDFTENIDVEFKKAVNQVLEENAKGLILDLRNNPGGYFERAIDLAGWFLKKGEVVVYEDYGGEEKVAHYSSGPAKLGEMPLVVLINEGSASSSEILAGALKDHQKAKLVGEKSFGKGLIQQLFGLEKNASVKLTIAKWLTPLGHSIEKEGITPDFEASYTLEDFNAGRDPQKEKAVEILKAMINGESL